MFREVTFGDTSDSDFFEIIQVHKSPKSFPDGEMLYQVLVILFVMTERSLNVVKIQNLGYQCRCVLAGNCDDNELSYSEMSHLRSHRVLRSRELCEKGAQECCGAIKPPSSHPPRPSSRQRNKCGIQKLPKSASVSTRITKDSQRTLLGELPWNLLILNSFKKENDPSYRCGASLIHPKVALTAAHCVESFAGYEYQIVVRAGEWDLGNEREPYEHQEGRVEEILVHPQYVKESLKNDIALVFLIEAFVMASNIGTICLSRIDLPSRCTVSGWGRKEYKTRAYSRVLKKVEVPLVDREICAKKWREIAPGKRFDLHASFMCAGGERDRDACTGDGGSPLVCLSYQHGRFVQAGIVSWGDECGREIPGIYVNVGLYLEWIDEAMLSRSLDVSFYKIRK